MYVHIMYNNMKYKLNSFVTRFFIVPAYIKGSDKSVFTERRSLSKVIKNRCKEREIKWPRRIPKI